MLIQDCDANILLVHKLHVILHSLRGCCCPTLYHDGLLYGKNLGVLSSLPANMRLLVNLSPRKMRFQASENGLLEQTSSIM